MSVSQRFTTVSGFKLLCSMARAQERTVLTRNRRLAATREGRGAAMVLDHNDVTKQLVQVGGGVLGRGLWARLFPACEPSLTQSTHMPTHTHATRY